MSFRLTLLPGLCALSLLATSGVADELARAQALAQKYPLVDTHVDTPYRVYDEWADVTQATADGDFDLPRARLGGLNVPFMSIYVPASTEGSGDAFKVANRLIDQVEAIAQRAPEHIAIATSTAEVEAQFAAGKLSLAMGMENGSPIEGKLENLAHFYQRGVRYITLAHSEPNHISDSSYQELRMWQGLSPFGKELVAAMNDTGMMVDISHVSDKAFYDALAVSRAPMIASHSSARHFTPEFERNMSDDMIKALASKGGVIMINFGSSFVTKAANEYFQAFAPARNMYATQNNTSPYSESGKAFEAAYRRNNPFPFASVADVADHVEHVVKLAGIDHVGIGSDYDGVGDSLPVGLKDVSQYPNLIAELLRRGFTEKDIARFLGGNLLRVWAEVESAAAR